LTNICNILALIYASISPEGARKEVKRQKKEGKIPKKAEKMNPDENWPSGAPDLRLDIPLSNLKIHCLRSAGGTRRHHIRW
jgi:hypothetical protein